MDMKLRFFYNGIKAADGKLQPAWYSDAALYRYPAGTITIYARRGCGRFSEEIDAAFVVQNDSDIMADYFECDRIRVELDHPLYPQVAEALEKMKAHGTKRLAKRMVGRTLITSPAVRA